MLDLVLIVLGIVVLLSAFYVMLFNGLVKARQQVKEAWSGIDVQLKRRHDLIPNLVSTVKGYAIHEQETLNQLVDARSRAIAVPPEAVSAKGEAENTLSGTLKSIFALAESYPDLKANVNYLEVQTQLAETEDQIASARRIYNNNSMEYNVKVHSFPSNIIAKKHGFAEAEFFELDAKEAEAIKAVPSVDL